MSGPHSDINRERFHGCAIGRPDDQCEYPSCLDDNGVCLAEWHLEYGGLTAEEWRSEAENRPEDRARVMRHIADVLDETERQLREEAS